jgi:hypothetical protein
VTRLPWIVMAAPTLSHTWIIPKSAHVVDVTAHGVVGDESTDNTAAIQTMIDGANETPVIDSIVPRPFAAGDVSPRPARSARRTRCICDGHGNGQGKDKKS